MNNEAKALVIKRISGNGKIAESRGSNVEFQMKSIETARVNKILRFRMHCQVDWLKCIIRVSCLTMLERPFCSFISNLSTNLSFIHIWGIIENKTL